MQRYELDDGGDGKFWEIEVASTTVTTKFGRIGTTGQQREKAFATEALAAQGVIDMIAEKTKAGYAAIGVAAATPKVATKTVAEKTKTTKTADKTTKTTKTEKVTTTNPVVETKPVASKAAKAAPVAAKVITPVGDGGFIATKDGYALGIVDGKVVCRSSKGAVLASVPKDQKDNPVFEQLSEVVLFLAAHTEETARTMEEWMLKSHPVPASVMASVWPDPAWQRALENAVVVADGTPGFLRGADDKKGIGMVTLDGETVWSKASAVRVPHPILLSELDEFRALLADLALTQSLPQLFRETFAMPKESGDERSVSTYAGGEFEQLNHALGRCKKHGYRVKGGSSVCRIPGATGVVEARFDLGGEDPFSECSTSLLTFIDEEEKTLLLKDVPPVAYSEGMRMASLVYAGRKIEKKGEA
jgi:predicted DNA-binding WGR domain protein